MDRKSEVFLNLINTFIYQVEAGEAYAQTPGVSLDDIEYIGFTLIVGAGDSGTYHCHAYGYEEGTKSHIMTLNAGGLIGKIKEFAAASADGNPAWKTCIIEIPEEIENASADFLYGRDAEPWISPSLRISEFVRPGTNADKNIEWNQTIYRTLHGVDRSEGLPKKRYVGAIEEVVQLPPELEAELDDALSSEIEGLFSNESDFVPVYSIPEEIRYESAKGSLPTAPRIDSKPFVDNHGTTSPDLESMFSESQQGALEDLQEEPAFVSETASAETKDKSQGGLFRKGGEAKGKWGLGKKKPEQEHTEAVLSVVEEPVPEKPKKITPAPKIIPKELIFPSFIEYTRKELQEKNIQVSKASIIIYLQPPVITSYGFWYGDTDQGHWMPESFDLDDTMDAFLRDTIPDPKNHWDVCIVRMDLEAEKVTTEFLKGRSGYPWMEAMAHRSKTLSAVAKYRSV